MEIEQKITKINLKKKLNFFMLKFSFFIEKKGPGFLIWIYLKQIVRLQPFLEKKEIIEKKIIWKIRRRNYSYSDDGLIDENVQALIFVFFS